MNPTKRLTKSLLTTSLAAALALASMNTFAQQESDSQLKTYTDPVSGELKIAPKLLSEMSEAEKAALSEKEKKQLKDIEAMVKKERERNK